MPPVAACLEAEKAGIFHNGKRLFCCIENCCNRSGHQQELQSITLQFLQGQNAGFALFAGKGNWNGKINTH